MPMYRVAALCEGWSSIGEDKPSFSWYESARFISLEFSHRAECASPAATCAAAEIVSLPCVTLLDAAEIVSLPCVTVLDAAEIVSLPCMCSM